MNPGATIEDVLEMSYAQMQAMTVEELEQLLRPALEKQKEILDSLPAPKGPTTISLKPRGSNAVAAAVMQDAMQKFGVTAETLAKFGVKLKS